MADIDLATILADGEYLKRAGDALVGDVPSIPVDAPDEVWIGTTEPTDPDIELWYDPDAVATSDAVVSTTVDTIVTLTQAAYDAIGTKDPTTLYFIT